MTGREGRGRERAGNDGDGVGNSGNGEGNGGRGRAMVKSGTDGRGGPRLAR